MQNGSESGRITSVGELRSFRFLAWLAFALLNVLYVVACVQRTAVPGSVFNDMQGAFGVTGAQVAFSGSLYVYIYGAMQIVAGVLIDRYGGKRASVFGGLLMGIGLLWLAYGKSLADLYLSRALTAFGQSFIYLAIVKISHIFFPRSRFGFLVGGVMMSVGYAGGILGTAPVAWISSKIGFGRLFAGMGIATCAVSCLMVPMLSSLREKRRQSVSVRWQNVKDLFNNPGRFCFVTHLFWTHAVFFVLQTIIGQKFIQDYFGFSAAKASVFTLSLSVTSVIAAVSGGGLLRILGGRRKPVMIAAGAIPFAVSLVLALAVWLDWPLWAVLAAYFAMALNQLGSVASSSLLGEVLDSRAIAFAASVRNAFPYVGAGVVGCIVGRALDSFSPEGMAGEAMCYPKEAYLAIFIGMAIFGFIGLVFTSGIPETRGKVIFSAKQDV